MAQAIGAAAWINIYEDRTRGEFVASVAGDAFALKNQLKAAGFKWNSANWEYGWNGRNNLADVIAKAIATGLPIFGSAAVAADVEAM